MIPHVAGTHVGLLMLPARGKGLNYLYITRPHICIFIENLPVRSYANMDKEEKRHPKDEASFISLVTLWWMFGLMWKGYTRPLQHEDLHSVRHEDLSKHLTKRLEEKWENEKRYASQSKTKPRLWKAVLRFFTWKNNAYIILTGLITVTSDNLVWFSTIKLLDLVLSGAKPRSQGLVYILGMVIGHLVRSLCNNHFFLQGAMQGIRARAAVVGLLYKKVKQLKYK